MTAPTPSRWLFGPVRDLGVGCGLLYLALFGWFALAGSGARAAIPGWLLPVLLVCVSTPHYGATLLRVYEERSDRRRYAVFAVWASLAVFALFALGLRDATVASLLLTLYLTWSPWHYTGQNYGLAVMFLRRRGIALDATTKRWLYAAFALSYGLVFLAFHAAKGPGAVQYAAAGYSDARVVFLSIGVPAPIARPLFAGIGIGTLLALGVAAARLLRRARPGDLLPPATLALTQALWFALPICFVYAGVRTGLEPIDGYVTIQEYAFWIAAGHGAQYLWVTTYYARAAGKRGSSTPLFLAKSLTAGLAIWTLPVLLFSPDLLGGASDATTLAVMIASAVNLHHFILDGAIWKLRDGPIARALLRGASDAVKSATSGWGRRALWVTACAWLALQGLGKLDWELHVLPASDPLDPPHLSRALERLRWLGWDDAGLRLSLGIEAGQRGELAEARREIRRSLTLEETARAWVAMSHVEVHSGRPEAARQALLRAVRAEPENPDAWAHSSQVWLALGDLAPARAALERALTLAPARDDLRQQLARLPDGEGAGPDAGDG